MGSKKAAVLPEPVWLETIKSLTTFSPSPEGTVMASGITRA